MFSACTTLLLWGCPGYGDSESCVRDAQCAPGYVCDTDAGRCVGDPTVLCDEPRDCNEPETCASDRTCRVGDCTWPDIGCVAGFECAAPDGIWTCVADGTAGSNGGSGGEGGASIPGDAGAGGVSVASDAGAGGVSAASAAGAGGVSLSTQAGVAGTSG